MSEKVLVIGSLVLDITASPIGNTKEWAEKQRIRSITMQVGGDAANQALHLAGLGLQPYLVSVTGSDENGTFLRTALAQRGVVTDYIARRTNISTGTALVLVDDAGNRSTFSVRGAHSTLQRQDLSWLNDETLAQFGAISLASPFSMPLLEEDGLLELLIRAKKLQIPVFSDLASDKRGQGLDGIRAFLPYFDYFLPSLYDAAAMTDAAAGTIPSAKASITDKVVVKNAAPSSEIEASSCASVSAAACASVFHACGTKNVVIKCGGEGAYVSAPDFTGMVSPAKVQVVDTTGAGDCMVAAFLSRILAGDGPQAAARFACAAGSWCTQYPGASTQVISEEAVRALMP